MSGFYDIAFTPSVKTEQAKHGSRAAYQRVAERGAGEGAPGLTDVERMFLADRDSFYLATVSETGWPYVQHRGGPPGFVRVLDDSTLAWAEFSGNKQYISIGNLAADARASVIFVDYPARRRLKILGRLRVVEAGTVVEAAAELTTPGYPARVEHVMALDVRGFDWNCPQHITPRFSPREVQALMGPLQDEIERLKAELRDVRSPAENLPS